MSRQVDVVWITCARGRSEMSRNVNLWGKRSGQQ